MIKGSNEHVTLSNTLYVLADVLETDLMEVEQAFRKDGFCLRYDAKKTLILRFVQSGSLKET